MIWIGHLFFETKLDAKKYFGGILNDAILGSALMGETLDDVLALLSCHPRAQEKIGVGVGSIRVDVAPFNGRCFHVERDDGTVVDFSYLKCVDGEKSPFAKFSGACRRVVEVDVWRFRDEEISTGRCKCENVDDVHVDHVFPATFSRLVLRFILENEICLSTVTYLSDEKSYGATFVDQTLVQNFRAFHGKNAVLKIIPARQNLATSHLGRLSQAEKDELNF